MGIFVSTMCRVMMLVVTMQSHDLAELPPFTPDANIARAKIPECYKWDLKPLFADDDAFEKALVATGMARTQLPQFRGKLADPKCLEVCLNAYFLVRQGVHKLTSYAGLRLVTDQKSSAFQSMSDRAQKEMADFKADTAFIRYEVCAMDNATMEAAYSACPGLTRSRSYLDEIRRRRAHLLEPKCERILEGAGDHLWLEVMLNEMPSDLERVYTALRADILLPKIKDEDGKEVQLTFSNVNKFRASTDRRVRREAIESFFSALKAYRNVFASTLSGEIRFHTFLAKARGYSNTLAAYLDREQIDPELYWMLIRTVRENLRPLHRYVALRKRMLGISEVRLYDMFTSLVTNRHERIPFAEGTRIISGALEPFGAEYGTVLKTALNPRNGWLDLYPHVNKEAGASALSIYGVHPFVKLNYQEGFDDMSVLAHEMGHAVQAHVAMAKQPCPTWDMATVIVEIPSILNEILLNRYLFAHSKSNDEKLYVLACLADEIRATLYRQTMFAEFELVLATATEKGDSLNADFLCGTYRKLVEEYYGKEYVVGEDDDIEWASVPHFYWKFYMYSYAMGLCAGTTLAEKLVTGEAGSRETYLAFLASGNSKPPIETLRAAGVDLMQPQIVVAATRLMDRTVDEIEAILAKREK